MATKFLVIVERGENNYSAYSPDVSGCVATGGSIEATLEEIRNALEFHFEGLVQAGEELPEPKSLNYYPPEKTDEISNEDIIAHIDISVPELAPA
jgi:predicted RNase H-like HicB family nuclease